MRLTLTSKYARRELDAIHRLLCGKSHLVNMISRIVERRSKWTTNIIISMKVSLDLVLDSPDTSVNLIFISNGWRERSFHNVQSLYRHIWRKVQTKSCVFSGGKMLKIFHVLKDSFFLLYSLTNHFTVYCNSVYFNHRLLKTTNPWVDGFCIQCQGDHNLCPEEKPCSGLFQSLKQL